MCGLEHEMAAAIHMRRLFMGISAPQHEDDGICLVVYLRDNRIGKRLPALFAMRRGLGHFDREDAVEQKHALPRPMLQKTMARAGEPQVAF